MHVLKQMGDAGHEQVVFLRDAGAGLTAIVAIHSTMLGPALGGTRMTLMQPTGPSTKTQTG
jgi:leucine dehydrogenase